MAACSTQEAAAAAAAAAAGAATTADWSSGGHDAAGCLGEAAGGTPVSRSGAESGEVVTPVGRTQLKDQRAVVVGRGGAGRTGGEADQVPGGKESGAPGVSSKGQQQQQPQFALLQRGITSRQEVQRHGQSNVAIGVSGSINSSGTAAGRRLLQEASASAVGSRGSSRSGSLVTQEKLQLLAGMGFSELQSKRALWVTNGDVGRAIEWCLQAGR